MMQACHGGLPVAALSVRAAHALALRSFSPNHFAILFAAFFFVPCAYAETINSTVTSVKISDIERSWGAPQASPDCATGTAVEKFPSSEQACNCAKSVWNTEVGAKYGQALTYAFEDNASNKIYGYCYFRRFASDGEDLGWAMPSNYSSIATCPVGTSWNADGCYESQYTCPSTGGWILSADKLTCSRCPDPAAPILTSEGACVGPKDKGADCEQPPGSSGPSSPFL